MEVPGYCDLPESHTTEVYAPNSEKLHFSPIAVGTATINDQSTDVSRRMKEGRPFRGFRSKPGVRDWAQSVLVRVNAQSCSFIVRRHREVRR